MAYMNQEKKKAMAPKIKEVLKRHGIKGSISVKNHSTLTVKLKSGIIDLMGEYNKARGQNRQYTDLNNYHYNDECVTEEARAFYKELIEAMNEGNHDNSDIYSDYFDVGWYININIGDWKKSYTFEKG